MSFRKAASNAGMAIILVALLTGVFYLTVALLAGIISLFKPSMDSEQAKDLAKLIAIVGYGLLLFFWLG